MERSYKKPRRLPREENPEEEVSFCAQRRGVSFCAQHSWFECCCPKCLEPSVPRFGGGLGSARGVFYTPVWRECKISGPLYHRTNLLPNLILTFDKSGLHSERKGGVSVCSYDPRE